jgi:chemotaxis protein MotB
MRRVTVLATAALGLQALGGGCVQQDVHDRALLTIRAQEEQILQLERQLATSSANLTTAKAELATLRSDVSSLESAIGAQTRRSDQWLQRVGRYQPLPLELELALDELAGAFPDVLSFDARQGVLRFSADLTFDSGSADLKPEAEATIATLAGILNGVDARDFELHVIGHTDTVPIERPDTRRRHPTNLHLSVHRAISVADALRIAGIEAERIMVAGYGEWRPLVPNGSKGAARNRRVEIFLAPLPDAEAQDQGKPAKPQTEVPSK